MYTFYSWAGPWIALLVWQGQSINGYKCFLLLSLINRKIESLQKVNKIKEEVGNEKRTKGLLDLVNRLIYIFFTSATTAGILIYK